jgi:hypothetical protein
VRIDSGAVVERAASEASGRGFFDEGCFVGGGVEEDSSSSMLSFQMMRLKLLNCCKTKAYNIEIGSLRANPSQEKKIISEVNKRAV